MKTMIAVALAAAVLVAAARADEKNGLRVSVQKTVLEKDKNHTGAYWESISKALALKVSAKNISLKEMPEGEVNYTILVKRWGNVPPLYHRYAGTETLAALKPGEEAELTLGKVSMGGYENSGNRKQYADSVEAWQVSVNQNQKETIKITSTGSFEKLDAKAKVGPK